MLEREGFMSIKDEKGRENSKADRGTNFDDQEWWNAADPEKASRFLKMWHEYLSNSEREQDFEVIRKSTERIISSFAEIYQRGLANSLHSKGSGESDKECVKDEFSKDTASSDAVMGIILSLLQRQDRIEQRLMDIEKRLRKEG